MSVQTHLGPVVVNDEETVVPVPLVGRVFGITAGSADDANRPSAHSAGNQGRVTGVGETLRRDLPPGRPIATTVSGVDDLAAEVLVILVATGHDNRLGTSRVLCSADARLDRSVHL